MFLWKTKDYGMLVLKENQKEILRKNGLSTESQKLQKYVKNYYCL